MRVFDLHCDTLTLCKRNGWGLDNEGKSMLRLSDAAEFDAYIQLYAVFIPDELRGRPAQNYFTSHHAYYRRQLEEAGDRLFDIACSRDLEQAPARRGKMCSILAVEGGAVLGGELEMLDVLRNAGVRSMTLTWNGENEIAGGTDSDAGLTEFGREAIALMERYGIAVDVSHLNDRSFYDVFDAARKPVIATHSCSRRICGHRRNLTDEMFQMIAQRGGLVGLNYARDFIAGENEEADLEAMARHIEHFLYLGGENVLALGSDYDGAVMHPCIDRPHKQKDLYRRLTQNGISAEQADKIFYLNAYHYFDRLMADDF